MKMKIFLVLKKYLQNLETSTRDTSNEENINEECLGNSVLLMMRIRTDYLI